MKTVVLGAYGNFGARISRALSRDSTVDLVLAGRDAARARSLADALDATAAVLDVASPDLADRLIAMGAELVIHTAGPFQAQGYAVARAAAAAACHYIDLADGRRFVCDFPAQLNGAFQAAQRCGISGASTVPALSSAVVDALLARFKRLEGIDFCIAPAQRAPRGPATIAGVLSYCGAPIRVWKSGAWHTEHGWSRPTPVRFARMRSRRGALCDVPDLELFVDRYPSVQHVRFRAALEVAATQYAFAALAACRRVGVPLTAPWLPGLLHRAGAVFDRLGTPTGAMVVRVWGQGLDGEPLQLAWHVTAPAHNGPEIPCMAAILLARKLARGHIVPVGARACTGLLTLADFQPEFAHWGMETEVFEEEVVANGP